MGYFERKQEAELALQAAESEYKERVSEARKELKKLTTPREKEIEELSAQLEIVKTELDKTLSTFDIPPLNQAVLYPDRLVYGNQVFDLTKGINTQVSTNPESVFLSLVTPEMQTTLQVPIAREGECRAFADKVSNQAHQAASVREANTASQAAIQERINELSMDTPEIAAAKEKLAQAEADTTSVDSMRASLQDLIDNPSEEDLAEIAAAEEERARIEAAEQEEKAAKAAQTRNLLIKIGAGLATVIAFVAIMFGTHIWCFHSWAEATCTEPAKCEICGRTQGEALGHDWEDADCEHPKTCKRCDKTEGKALGHKWVDATCTEPKTCSVCEKTEGDALGHDVPEWTRDIEPTCTQEGHEKGSCARCGEVVERVVPKSEHTEGEWVVTVEPSISGSTVIPGKRTLKCSVCGGDIRTEEFTPSPEEIAATYKESCESLSYEEISRNPDSYRGRRAVFRGEVAQVLEDGSDVQLRVNVTDKGYGWWDDTIFVFYTLPSGSGRILEGDVITIYGEMRGTISYETVLGATVTIPAINAEYIDY